MDREKLKYFTTPELYFQHRQCRYSCFWQPCRWIRSMGLRSTICTFVLRRQYGYDDCRFSITSSKEVEMHLRRMPLQELNRLHRGLLSKMTESERLHYNPDLFYDLEHDRYGRIEYFQYLLKKKVIAAIGLPLYFQHDNKLVLWLYAFWPSPGTTGEEKK